MMQLPKKKVGSFPIFGNVLVQSTSEKLVIQDIDLHPLQVLYSLNKHGGFDSPSHVVSLMDIPCSHAATSIQHRLI